MLMPYVPYPVDRGTYQRVFHLFAELSKAFSIDLACLCEEGDTDRNFAALAPYTHRQVLIPFRHPPWARLFPQRLLNPMPTTVHHWQSASVTPALQTFVEGRRYDYVYFFDLVLWPYVQRLFGQHPRYIMDRSRVDWLFQSEELRTLKLRPLERLLRRENLLKIALMERKVYRQVRDMIVCGWDDKAFLRSKLGMDDKIFVLPNGYNPGLFDASLLPREVTEQPTLLFCGALDYSPNVDAIDWFLKAIWPQIHQHLPTARWRIVGKSPGKAAQLWARQPGVELIGEVPDVRPWYQSSWLQVVPLRIGGGTRLKIVESLAMQCPVVSTTLGAQGLNVRHNHDITLVDTPTDWVDAIVRLCSEPQQLKTMAQRGEQTVQRNYRWEQLGLQLIQHLLRAE